MGRNICSRLTNRTNGKTRLGSCTGLWHLWSPPTVTAYLLDSPVQIFLVFTHLTSTIEEFSLGSVCGYAIVCSNPGFPPRGCFLDARGCLGGLWLGRYSTSGNGAGLPWFHEMPVTLLNFTIVSSLWEWDETQLKIEIFWMIGREAFHSVVKCLVHSVLQKKVYKKK